MTAQSSQAVAAAVRDTHYQPPKTQNLSKAEGDGSKPQGTKNFRKRSRKNTKCYNCEKLGHISEYCPITLDYNKVGQKKEEARLRYWERVKAKAEKATEDQPKE